MTTPDFLSGIVPEPAPEPVVPDHNASDDRPGFRLNGRRGQRGKTATEPRPSKPRKPAPAYQPGLVRERMLSTYGALAFAVMPFKPTVAVTIMGPAKAPTEEDPNPQSVAENCADAWEAAAKVYPWVRQMMEGGEKIAVIVGLLMAHGPIFAAMVEGTPLAEKLSPAAAMEAMLRRGEETPTE